MKISLSEMFKSFFKEHGLLELEGIIEEDGLSTLRVSLTKPISGRNSWQKDPSIKKLLHKLNLSSLFASLVRKTPIRLGYSQVLAKKYAQEVPKGNHPLQEISSISPVLGGLILCINATKVEKEKIPSLSKQTKGHVIFFTNETPLPLEELVNDENYLGLLIVFAPATVRYRMSPLDPRTHDLKKKGLAFGDLLSEEQAPYFFS